MKILSLFKELEDNNAAQTVALIYEKLFGLFYFILICISVFLALIFFEMGAGKYYVGMLGLNMQSAPLSALVFAAIFIGINLVLIFIFGILATFISINSYLRQISKITTITK